MAEEIYQRDGYYTYIPGIIPVLQAKLHNFLLVFCHFELLFSQTPACSSVAVRILQMELSWFLLIVITVCMRVMMSIYL